MPLTRSTLTAALAALLLAAPAATAQPADIHAQLSESPVAANTQDLRSPDTRDAAERDQGPTSSLAGTSTLAQDPNPAQAKHLPGPPSWPMNPQPITSAPSANATNHGNGVDWTTIVLGLAGSLLALGGLAALTRHTKRLRTT